MSAAIALDLRLIGAAGQPHRRAEEERALDRQDVELPPRWAPRLAVTALVIGTVVRVLVFGM